MCCGFAFWKRLIAFGLTFWLGAMGASLLTFSAATSTHCPAVKKELPAATQNFEYRAAPETKNCVPVDTNLKYERLTAEDQNKSNPQNQTDQKKALKESKEKQKKSFKPEKPLFDSSEDSAEIKNLLHKEQCY